MKNPITFRLTPEVRSLFHSRPGISPRAALEVALLGAGAAPLIPSGERVCCNLSEEAREALVALQEKRGVSRNCLINDLIRAVLLSSEGLRRAT